jgi:uncharacterized protein (DUF433 family)
MKWEDARFDMVRIQQEPQLGVGLYTPREAAVFAKLRTATFNRWFFGNARGEAALRPRFAPEGGEYEDRVVTFWDLIQAVAVRTLRRSERGSRIRLHHIREVVEKCEDENINFPLARNHSLYWFSNRLILKIDEDRYIGLTSGLDKDQLYDGRIIEPFLQDVTFADDSDAMARRWIPLRDRKYEVSLDVDRRFGMPVIEPAGILVSALVDAVYAEGSIEGAADSFETETEAVRLALKYREYLSSAA